MNKRRLGMRTTALVLLLSGCSDYKLTAPSEVLPGQPLEVTGSRWWSQSWELAITQTDILFFGDTSGSMAEELTTLGDEITTFIDTLARYDSQWQLLAVTGPDGCGINGVLTPETPEYAALFASGMLTPPGADEVDEWGLYNAQMAINAAAPGGCNEGFLRDEANLHIIFISDEDDNSPGFDSGDALYWQPYADAIRSIKDDEKQVTFSAVAGPWPDGCEGAEPGTGYAQAVEYTGGSYISICEDWAIELSSLAEVSVQRRTFALEKIPDPATLQVVVESIDQVDTWYYDELANAVVFDTDPPVSGESVVIRYQIAE